MTMPEKIYATLENKLKLNGWWHSKQGLPDEIKYHRHDLYEALEAENARLRNGLKMIADYTHECGCVPCRDQCKSKEALQVTLDCIIDDAREALAQQIGEKK